MCLAIKQGMISKSTDKPIHTVCWNIFGHCNCSCWAQRNPIQFIRQWGGTKSSTSALCKNVIWVPGWESNRIHNCCPLKLLKWRCNYIIDTFWKKGRLLAGLYLISHNITLVLKLNTQECHTTVYSCAWHRGNPKVTK